MQIKTLTSMSEMLLQFELIKYLYPEMSVQKYENYLQAMQPQNYVQVAVFDDKKCVGMTGLWSGVKLWTGKYLEIDNFIVHPEARERGVGKMICDYVDKMAIEQGCTCVVLDAFTGNFKAHKFYYNLGYEPRGFHFIKVIDKNGFS